jgi:thiol:disulfide interchange protein DsbD
VLLSVSTVGDPLLGALALFMLGLGLTTPLMILGATEGRLLPQSGDWMNGVRQVFGLLLLGVSLLLLGRVFDNSMMLLAWSVLVMLLAAWMWQWAGRGRWVSQALALVLAGWSGLQLVGVAQGQHDPWRPLAVTTVLPVTDVATVQSVQTITRLDQLLVLQQQTPRLLVDVTADWCISCKIMERELFGATALPALAGWTRVKLDVTASGASSQQALDALQLFGPPALLFYVDGHLVARLVGETAPTVLQTQLVALADR